MESRFRNGWIVSRRELRDGETAVPRVFALSLLNAWRADSFARKDALALYGHLTGRGSVVHYPLSSLDVHRFVKPRLERALENGELIVVERLETRRRHGGYAGAAEAPAPSTKASSPPPELSWIEFVLLDPQGQPVSGRSFRVKLPDGTSRTGKTDGGGRVTLRDIEAGECEFTLTDLDAGAWKRA